MHRRRPGGRALPDVPRRGAHGVEQGDVPFVPAAGNLAGHQLGMFSAQLILERTKALGMQGLVTIWHGYGLADLAAGVHLQVPGR
ncbi:hypothetical protein ARTHRO9AX_80125 [Arthrobacter sp. 9AX]|uniref:hypothetical protein n=1 Tax=Arthrobacter sp. 9AX TaxID=2653131 RepID=UPI0012F12658|nr:hypothetical protein [Arthrobacter sp. 9AX]VXC51405.1 hypothetical protein ARTHRO9AX_80125 [Arthrobacter sp. 9AX]